MLCITCHYKLRYHGHTYQHGENPTQLQPQMLVRVRSSRNSHSLLVGMKNGAATLEDSWQFLTKLNIILLYDLAFHAYVYNPHHLKLMFT